MTSDMHQWELLGGDYVVSRWVCCRCGTKIMTPNFEDDPSLPDNFYLMKKGIPTNCNEALIQKILND